MNKEAYAYYQPMNSPPNTFGLTRAKLNTCRIVLITSLFWVLVDAFVLLYFTDCTNRAGMLVQQPCNDDQRRQMMPENLITSDLVFGRDRERLVLNKNRDGGEGVDDGDKDENNDNVLDYDDKLKGRNERLHKIHKLKRKSSKAIAQQSVKLDAQANFLNKIKEWFREDNSNEPRNPSSWPGENGRAAVIPENLKEESQRRFKENQFNIVASDLIALNRSVPDQRSDACRKREYPVDLPTTSIIIVYHNEGNSTLLRGLTSIVRKSPIKYLKEIILVDDASENREYLHDPLDQFVKTLSVPVKIFRNKERLGLMRSRLRGADAATGDTMTFLDAHIECTDGWLPPLLSEIRMNRLTSASFFLFWFLAFYL
jgi:hypothetical protein